MKKAIALLTVLLLVLSCSAAFADMYEDVMKRGSLIIGTEGEWRPWTYHDEGGTKELIGFDVEVGKAICEKLGVTASFTEANWDSLLAALKSGRIDTMINGMDVTESRKEAYDFTIPYCYTRTALVVRGDNTDITTFTDLAGRTTANSISSTYMTLAESYGAFVESVDTLEETITMVLHGRADATLNAVDSIADYMMEHPEADIKIVALTEEANEVAIPVPKNEPAMLEAMNKAIEELRADGTLAALSVKYFGEDITAVPVNAE